MAIGANESSPRRSALSIDEILPSPFDDGLVERFDQLRETE